MENESQKAQLEQIVASVKKDENSKVKNYRKIGLRFLWAPLVGILIATIGLVAIQSLKILLGIDVGESTIVGIIINIASFFLMAIGILAIISFPICIPIGIVFFTRRQIMEGVQYDDRSGKKDTSIIPDEIKGWNWGAAGLTWIWGLSHRVWVSLLVFIPLVNIVMWIVLGLKGSEWAWRAQKWESVEKFTELQNKWKPWGILFFCFSILGLLSNIFLGR